MSLWMASWGLSFAALSTWDERVVGLALGASFVIIGASLVIRGEKAGVWPFRDRAVRSAGAVTVFIGALFAALGMLRPGACTRCSNVPGFIVPWLIVIAGILGANLRRIWRKAPDE